MGTLSGWYECKEEKSNSGLARRFLTCRQRSQAKKPQMEKARKVLTTMAAVTPPDRRSSWEDPTADELGAAVMVGDLIAEVGSCELVAGSVDLAGPAERNGSMVPEVSASVSRISALCAGDVVFRVDEDVVTLRETVVDVDDDRTREGLGTGRRWVSDVTGGRGCCAQCAVKLTKLCVVNGGPTRDSWLSFPLSIPSPTLDPSTPIQGRCAIVPGPIRRLSDNVDMRGEELACKEGLLYVYEAEFK